MQRLVIALIAIIAFMPAASAKKADWPVGNGTGVIGFGVVELLPKQVDGKNVPTYFRFHYHVDAKFAAAVNSGQVAVFRSATLAQYNDISNTQALTHVRAENLKRGTDFDMGAQIQISEPGLYIVVYGPWDGMIAFDAADSDQGYKISAEAPEGGSFRWLDQDAGDFTTLNYAAVPNSGSSDFIFRIRMVRNQRMVLQSKDASSFGPLTLNPQAQERVNLLEAKW
jgi:hypothetical protein